MFERQLGLRENPFLAGHHPKFVYPSREHQEALAHLRYGIQNREPFVLITGEVGTGKTTAVYDALGEWGSRAVVALITNSALTRAELLEEICLRFGVAAPGPLSKPQALVQLERLLSAVSARGALAILLLDEAQNLDRELLEEIRLLSNLEVQGEKLLQIFLVGQPELETKLAQPELRQLRQRIGIHYRILPLSATETANYIHHRVAVAGGNAHEMFPPDTCVEVFRITNGIPREINIVAGQALLNAFVEDSRTVTAEHVRSVEREIEFQSVLRDRSQVVRPAAPPPPAAGPPPQRQEAAPAAPRPAPPEPVREPYPALSTPMAPPAPEREPAPAAAPSAWTPVVDPFLKPSHASESYVAGIPPVTQPQPPVHPESEPVSERAASYASPAPAQPIAVSAAADPSAPILPSWFDEVVERRRRIEEQEAEPAAAATPLPPASAPTFVPPAPGLPAPTESFPMEEPPADAPVPMSSQPPESFGVPVRPTSSIDFLTQRLREKLEKGEAPAPKKRSGSGSGWLVAATLVAAAAIGAILMVRFGPWTLLRQNPAPTPATARPTAPSTQAAVPTQTPAGATPQKQEVAPSASAPATGGAPVPVTAAVKPPPPTPVKPTPVTATAASRLKPATGVSSAGATTGAPPPSKRPPAAKKPAIAPDVFGIAVGTYLDEDRAIAERTSLTESTRLPSRVVTVAEDSVSMYRVVMGSFENRISAERMASDLVRRGLVNEARVVPMARVTPPLP